MNSLNDSLLVGILVTLVFGAVCFYLYSRITQNEKRVSLLENLLLDLKLSTEAHLAGPELLGPDIVEAVSGPAPLDQTDVDDTLQGDLRNGEKEDDVRMYEEMARRAAAVATGSSAVVTSNSGPTTPRNSPSESTQDMEEQPRSTVLEAARAAAAAFTNAKIENNYEAMSVKELQAAVKSRGISPVPRVRKELIEALKRHDAGEPQVSSEKVTLDSFMGNGGSGASVEGEGFSLSLDGNQESTLDEQFGGVTDLGNEDDE